MLLESRPEWFALTVKPNREKTAALALECKGLRSYLPVYRARRRWSDRIRELDLPLFTGYVFCRFLEAERSRVLATPAVTSVVGFGRRPEPVGEEEIEAIQKMLASGLLVEPWPFLRVGERVRIESGSLCGLEGILKQVKDAWRVVVGVELLQRSVAVEIDRDALGTVRSHGPNWAAGPRSGELGWRVHACP